MGQYIDSKMMKHLEAGGVILHDSGITYGLTEVRRSIHSGEKVWSYKKEPKYVYRRTIICDDGSEYDTRWYLSKKLFMENYAPSGTTSKFGPWQKRKATEVCDD